MLEETRKATEAAKAAAAAGDGLQIAAATTSGGDATAAASTPSQGQHQTLSQLTAELKELEQEVAETHRRQLQIEDEITAKGGVIHQPLPRVWSPNYRPARTH